VHCVPHLAGILLNSKAADFVVTGCGTGMGSMLACNSIFFSPATFLRDRADSLPVTSERLMSELSALVERLAMPVLDLARDLRGLDIVMNDPCDLLLPTHSIRSQAKSPNFENRVAALRAFVRTRADVSEGDLDRLVAYLRSDQ
jgi:hypothetical protein